MKKRIFSLVLALLLLAGALPHAAAAAETQAPPPALELMGPWGQCSAWAADYMERAGTAGLIPDALRDQNLAVPISRAEFAAVAVRLYEAFSGSDSLAPTENPFTDTTDPDVLLAWQLGIVNGIGDGKFAPEDTLTREQAAAMLGRVYELYTTKAVSGGAGLPQARTHYDDEGQIHDYARSYISFFTLKSVINGMGGNSFVPLAPMTREQAIKIAIVAKETLK